MRSALAFLLVGVLTAPTAVAANEEVWALLKGGGHVILIRHAITTPGVGDPPGMRVDDCSTQRNLTDEGRRDARHLGEAFRARGLVVDRVLSSPWCRCLETARLAFGAAEVWQPLGNLFGRDEARAEPLRQMRALIGERHTGGNVVLVSHGATISALTGVIPLLLRWWWWPRKARGASRWPAGSSCPERRCQLSSSSGVWINRPERPCRGGVPAIV